MTQIALSQKTDLPQTLISRLENAVSTDITEEQLSRLSSALTFPELWFTEPASGSYSEPLSLHSVAFRKAASPSKKKIDFVVALANHYSVQISKLLEAIDLEVAAPIPSFELIRDDDHQAALHASAVSSPEEAAQRLRQVWNIGRGPIHNLTALVEASGIVVIHADFDGVDADGVTLRTPGLKPIIFLNSDRPACRQRFSLAHELGHVVLHAFHTPDMELEANRFAAEFLMPKVDVKSDLSGRLSVSRLGQLKLKWKVSMGALLYRAQETRLQSPHTTKRLWIQMSQAGYRTREPEEFSIEREKPTIFSRLIEAHLNELAYSTNELAILLRTEVGEFREMAGLVPKADLKIKKTKLRVVVDNSKSA